MCRGVRDALGSLMVIRHSTSHLILHAPPSQRVLLPHLPAYSFMHASFLSGSVSFLALLL